MCKCRTGELLDALSSTPPAILHRQRGLFPLHPSHFGRPFALRSRRTFPIPTVQYPASLKVCGRVLKLPPAARQFVCRSHTLVVSVLRPVRKELLLHSGSSCVCYSGADIDNARHAVHTQLSPRSAHLP